MLLGDPHLSQSPLAVAVHFPGERHLPVQACSGHNPLPTPLPTTIPKPSEKTDLCRVTSVSQATPRIILSWSQCMCSFVMETGTHCMPFPKQSDQRLTAPWWPTGKVHFSYQSSLFFIFLKNLLFSYNGKLQARVETYILLAHTDSRSKVDLYVKRPRPTEAGTPALGSMANMRWIEPRPTLPLEKPLGHGAASTRLGIHMLASSSIEVISLSKS